MRAPFVDLGTCPSCRKEIAVKADGTLRRHQPPSSPQRFGHPPCKGSGSKPTAVNESRGRWDAAKERRDARYADPTE